GPTAATRWIASRGARLRWRRWHRARGPADRPRRHGEAGLRGRGRPGRGAGARRRAATPGGRANGAGGRAPGAAAAGADGGGRAGCVDTGRSAALRPRASASRPIGATAASPRVTPRAAHASSALDASFLDWPFCDDGHRRLADALDRWADQHLDDHALEEADV